MQAYAYCGCYYTLPASLAECANEQLQPQPPDIVMAPTISAPVTAIPAMVVSAATAEKEPTPAVLAVSEGAASSSSQSTTSFSDPQPSSSPTIHILSLKWTMPSSNPGTAWTPIAAPSTSTERITVVVTYTTTLIAAGYTTTAILTSISISTEYTCADGSDVKLLVSAASASAPPGSTPIVLAPMDPETFTPYSAVVPAQRDLYLSICGGASAEDRGWNIRGISREKWECGAYEVSKKVEDILKN
ncbi:MAG: hypothetical protein ASARMPRED_004180 [Alectoria sarmentosa]|nr:MAG: hypothetical protein ASARMPRED_004180 [Alectoria sarmentosa]